MREGQGRRRLRACYRLRGLMVTLSRPDPDPDPGSSLRLPKSFKPPKPPKPPKSLKPPKPKVGVMAYIGRGYGPPYVPPLPGGRGWSCTRERASSPPPTECAAGQWTQSPARPMDCRPCWLELGCSLRLDHLFEPVVLHRSWGRGGVGVEGDELHGFHLAGPVRVVAGAWESALGSRRVRFWMRRGLNHRGSCKDWG